MRRYDIVTGILLILSIIDFALAAPVSVQEKHQSPVDMVHIPKDVTTVLGKRWEEELEKLGEEYFETSEKPVETSGTHSSSSTAPSGPDHGSTTVVQPLAPNLASSTNPDSLMEPSCSPSSLSSTSLMQGLRPRGNCIGLLNDAILSGPYPMHGHGPMMYSLYRPLPVTEAPVPQPKPESRPSINPLHPIAEDPPPPSTPPRPAWPKVPNGQASGYAPGPPPTGQELSWSGPPPTEFYSTTVGPSSSTDAASPPTEPEHDVVPELPPSSDPELHLEHLSLNADSQPVDLQAAIYAVKGKAKVSRGIPGIARDVGNVAQRDSELQPAERSLDSGE